MRTASPNPALALLALLALVAGSALASEPAPSSEPAPRPDAPAEAIGQPGQPFVVSPGVRVLRDDAPPPKPIPPELLAQLLRMEREREAERGGAANPPTTPR